MKTKLSLLLAATLAAEMFIAAPAGAAPLRPTHSVSEPAPLVTEVNHRRRHWGGRGNHWRGRGGGNIAGAIIGGFAAGAIISGLAARPRYHDPYYDDYYAPRYVLPRAHYRASGLDRHQSWCLNRWRSYDVYSDTYQPYEGRRRYCNSPFN